MEDVLKGQTNEKYIGDTGYVFSNFEVYNINEEVSHSICHFFRILVSPLASLKFTVNLAGCEWNLIFPLIVPLINAQSMNRSGKEYGATCMNEKTRMPPKLILIRTGENRGVHRTLFYLGR